MLSERQSFFSFKKNLPIENRFCDANVPPVTQLLWSVEAAERLSWGLEPPEYSEKRLNLLRFEGYLSYTEQCLCQDNFDIQSFHI